MKDGFLKILVVDDDVVVCQLLVVILSRMGHFVETSYDGKDAMGRFHSNAVPFDVVITDHNMPGACGLKLVDDLRKNSYSGKIIVVSGGLTRALENAYRSERVDKILQNHSTDRRWLQRWRIFLKNGRGKATLLTLSSKNRLKMTGGDFMSDDKSKKGKSDRIRINIHEAYELRDWAERFGVSQDRLKRAVEKVGPMVSDVEDELKK